MISSVLQSHNIDLLDAELILAHVLNVNKTWLLAHPNAKLTEELQKEFEELIARRKKHEPIAYILGEKEIGRAHV